MTIFKTSKFPVIFITLLFFSSLFSQTNKIVAVVNDEVVTQNQLNQIIYTLKQQAQSQGFPIDSEAKLRAQALNQLIDNKLLLQIAKQNDIVATDAEVNQQIQMIAAKNTLPLEKFKEALVNEGSSFKAYQEFIKNQITLNKLQSQFLGPKIKLTEKDIQIEMALLNKTDTTAPVEILDVLIKPTPGNEAQALKTASKIRERLIKGLELQEIKKQTHTGVEITSQNLGWKNLSELPDLFSNAVKNLQKGQVTQPLEAPNGIHLLMIINRKSGDSLTRKDAEQIAIHKKMQAEVEKWLVDLKKQAYIEIK